MTVTEVCLVIIAACMVLLVLGMFSLALVWALRSRAIRKRVALLIDKIDGIIDNLSAISLAARDQVDELKTVVDDVSYRTRVMAQDIRARVISPIVDIVTAFSGIARLLAALFGRGGKG